MALILPRTAAADAADAAPVTDRQTDMATVLICAYRTRVLHNNHQRIIKDKSNILFYLLPAKRNVKLTTRLRCARQHPTIYARTNRYKNSFNLFGLNHFQ